MRPTTILPLLALLLLVPALGQPAPALRLGAWSLVAQDCPGDYPEGPADTLGDQDPLANTQGNDLVALYAADAATDGGALLLLAIVFRPSHPDDLAPAPHELVLTLGLEGSEQSLVPKFNVWPDTATQAEGPAADHLRFEPRWTGPRPSWAAGDLQAIVLGYAYEGPLAAYPGDLLTEASAIAYPHGVVDSEPADQLNPGAFCRTSFTLALLDAFGAPRVVAGDRAPPLQPYALAALPPAIAAFSADRATAFTGQIVRFDGSILPGGGELEGVVVDFGDGLQASTLPVDHAYLEPGHYTARLTVREVADFYGGNDTRTLQVQVLNRPPEPIILAPAGIAINTPVTLRDASTDLGGQVVAWSWRFPDGSSQATRDATFTFPHAGQQTIELTVTDDEGATATARATVTVTQESPVADFAVPASIVVGQNASFLDRSKDFDGIVVRWSWRIDGAEASRTRNLTASFPHAGQATVELTVTDDQGASDKVLRTVNVLPAAVTPAAPPVAEQDEAPSDPAPALPSALGLSLQPPPGAAAGQAVRFEAEASRAVVAWEWDFGDGNTSFARSPEHAYAAPGSYTVRVKATATDGAAATAESVVAILGTETARPSPAAGLAALAVLFLAAALHRRRKF